MSTDHGGELDSLAHLCYSLTRQLQRPWVDETGASGRARAAVCLAACLEYLRRDVDRAVLLEAEVLDPAAAPITAAGVRAGIGELRHRAHAVASLASPGPYLAASVNVVVLVRAADEALA